MQRSGTCVCVRDGGSSIAEEAQLDGFQSRSFGMPSSAATAEQHLYATVWRQQEGPAESAAQVRPRVSLGSVAGDVASLADFSPNATALALDTSLSHVESLLLVLSLIHI